MFPVRIARAVSLAGDSDVVVIAGKGHEQGQDVNGIVSPFDGRLRYNLYSCLTILPAHQHRHLWQAERVLEELRIAT